MFSDVWFELCMADLAQVDLAPLLVPVGLDQDSCLVGLQTFVSLMMCISFWKCLVCVGMSPAPGMLLCDVKLLYLHLQCG